jgi:hypothetical protein
MKRPLGLPGPLLSAPCCATSTTNAGWQRCGAVLPSATARTRRAFAIGATWAVAAIGPPTAGGGVRAALLGGAGSMGSPGAPVLGTPFRRPVRSRGEPRASSPIGGGSGRPPSDRWAAATVIAATGKRARWARKRCALGRRPGCAGTSGASGRARSGRRRSSLGARRSAPRLRT